MQPIKNAGGKKHSEKDLVAMTMEIIGTAWNRGKVKGQASTGRMMPAHHFLEDVILWKVPHFSTAQLPPL